MLKLMKICSFVQTEKKKTDVNKTTLTVLLQLLHSFAPNTFNYSTLHRLLVHNY